MGMPGIWGLPEDLGSAGGFRVCRGQQPEGGLQTQVSRAAGRAGGQWLVCCATGSGLGCCRPLCWPHRGPFAPCQAREGWGAAAGLGLLFGLVRSPPKYLPSVWGWAERLWAGRLLAMPCRPHSSPAPAKGRGRRLLITLLPGAAPASICPVFFCLLLVQTFKGLLEMT